MGYVFDISICPTNMECDGVPYDESAVLDGIRELAENMYPGCRFATLQVGYNQGDEWFRCRVDGRRDETTDAIARDLVWEHFDWNDEGLLTDGSAESA